MKRVLNFSISDTTEPENFIKVRFVNISCIIALLLTPIIFLNNILIGSDDNHLPILFFFISCSICFAINAKNKNQTASIILIFCGIITSYWATYLNTVQISAPYFNIILSFMAMFLIKNKQIKILVATFALFSFLALNAYQIKFRPFVYEDYIPVAIMLIGLLISIYFYNKEYVRNQMLIKNQANTLIQLKNIEHQKTLQKKQKDLETIIANNRMQLKIKENILNKLRKINNIESNINVINSIKTELINDIDLQKKMQFLEDNINEVNSLFFEKLNNKHPNLSKKEKELCSYIKLKLSTKEIASLTNASVNTVYVTKNRLKVKLNLEDNSQIDTYLLNF
jgi:DNA-binding CsgD family transcriptional regulator